MKLIKIFLKLKIKIIDKLIESGDIL